MKRIEIIFLVFLLNFLATPLSSAFEDPSALMPQVDLFLGNSPFSEAFHAGESFHLVRTNCEKLANHCSKMLTRYEVLSANSDSGQVATYIGTRTSPSSLAKVTRLQWQQISGNMARNVVREIESFGAKVTLTDLREITVNIMVNGKLTNQPAIELSFVYKQAIAPQGMQRLILSPNLRGPGQIVLRFINDGIGSETSTELESCTLAL